MPTSNAYYRFFPIYNLALPALVSYTITPRPLIFPSFITLRKIFPLGDLGMLSTNTIPPLSHLYLAVCFSTNALRSIVLSYWFVSVLG